MSATPVVCIPGTLCDERVFTPVLPLHRPTMLWRYQMVELGADPQHWVVDMLETLPPRFALLGFSLGGLLALALCEMAPERVAGLALVASNARGAQPDHEHNRHALLQQWDIGGADAVVDALLPRYGLAQPCQRSTVRAMAHDHSRALFDAQLQLAAQRPDRSNVWQHAPGPALVISGELDSVCTPAMQTELHTLRPDAARLILPGIGHFPTLDAPEPCHQALTQWAHQIN